MTTIEKLQQLGAGQYIDFSIEGTDSALECYLCSDRHADAIKSIRILNVEGAGLVLEVELGEIMMFKPTTVYMSIEEKEIMDPVEARKLAVNKDNYSEDGITHINDLYNCLYDNIGE